MTLVWREQDRLAEFAPAVEPLLQQANLASARKLLAFFALDRGDVDQIAALVDEPIRETRDFIWLVDMCVTAELAAAAALPCIDELYAELLPFDGMVATMDGTFVCLGAVAHYLGLLAAARGRHKAAIAHLEAAVELNDRVRVVPWSARSRMHLAALLDSEPDRAAQVARDALRIAEEYDLTASRRQLQQLMRT
jgi:hypothetical protein